MGKEQRLAALRCLLAEDFPGREGTQFAVTSHASMDYNCIAWAAGDDSQWWEPHPLAQCHWPQEAPRESDIESWTAAFRSLGYGACGRERFERGWEKVAIFATPAGEPTHAARQLPNGRWTSKLGPAQDIEHELRALEGAEYGHVAVLLRRRAPGRRDSTWLRAFWKRLARWVGFARG